MGIYYELTSVTHLPDSLTQKMFPGILQRCDLESRSLYCNSHILLFTGDLTENLLCDAASSSIDDCHMASKNDGKSLAMEARFLWQWNLLMHKARVCTSLSKTGSDGVYLSEL